MQNMAMIVLACQLQEEKQEILGAVAALRAEQPEAVPEPLVAALGYGLAAHHAGCLPAWKSLIERCFQCGEALLEWAMLGKVHKGSDVVC
jgi:superfamily II RNA helicase